MDIVTFDKACTATVVDTGKDPMKKVIDIFQHHGVDMDMTTPFTVQELVEKGLIPNEIDYRIEDTDHQTLFESPFLNLAGRSTIEMIFKVFRAKGVYARLAWFKATMTCPTCKLLKAQEEAE